MKKYVSIVAIMLCAFIVNTNALTLTHTFKGEPMECACCKNCKDDKCKELCKKWAGMTPEVQKSEKGQLVKEECIKICKEKKCCSADGKGCESMMEGKDCCKKKK